MAKIDIVSGFLGAGKTTLIRKLLKEAFTEEKVVLIENEFGEIGIDGGFLQDTGIQITEMNSGCICCSLVGDFGQALKDVVKQYHPDRILIEPSGVGKLSDVIKAVQNVADEAGLVMNSFTTVVDAKKARIYVKNFGEFFVNQVEYAKTIVLSRTGDISQEKLEQSLALIRQYNDKAAIITTPWDQLDGKHILDVMEQKHSLEDELLEAARQVPESEHHHHDGEECCDHDHDHEEHEHHHHDHEEHEHHHHDHEGHHHADEVFTSWGTETAHRYSREEMEGILKELSTSDKYGTVLRAKGMVSGQENEPWIYFDLVPEEYEIRDGAPQYTGQLCVIGSQIKEDALKELFKAE